MDEQTLHFFKQVFSDPSAGFVLLWTLADRRSHWFSVARLAEAAAAASATRDVYVGCGLRGHDQGERARGEDGAGPEVAPGWRPS